MSWLNGVFVVVGVIVGGLVTGAVEWWHERRRERALYWTAVRLLKTDLDDALGQISASIDGKTWTVAISPQVERWAEYRAVVAASSDVSNEELDTVAMAFRNVEMVHRMFAARVSHQAALVTLSDETLERLQRFSDRIAAGRDVLNAKRAAHKQPTPSAARAEGSLPD